MSKKWACRTYYNPNPFISFSWHDTIMMVPVPPFVLPTKAFHLDFSVVQGLWIGSFLSNGKGKKIVGDDLLFMGRTSDAGLFIPHISFPPTWMNILTTLFGSSMILFGCSSVTLACKNIIWGNDDCDLAATPFGPVPLSLNLACHDPYSFPTDIVVVWGSIYSGMSLSDLFAALIDFAINLACEFGMKHLAEPLASKAGQGLKKLGGKMSGAYKKVFPKAVAAAAKKRAAKGASKGVFAKAFTAMSKLAGTESTDAMKAYTKKAAKTRGMYNTLKEMCYSTGKNLDSDLSDLIKQGTPGVFSKDFLSEMQSINSKKYDDYVSEMMPKMKKTLKQSEESGNTIAKNAYDDEFIDHSVDDVSDHSNDVGSSNKYKSVVNEDEDSDYVVKYKSYMTDDIAIDSVMRTTLFDAMTEMSEAAEKAASTELARTLGYKALKKSLSQILWKYTIKNGGLISVHANILGYDLDYDSSSGRQFTEKWYTNQNWFGYQLWDAGDLGLTESDDSEYWDEAYVEGDGTDDDYWYVDVADDSSSTSSDSTSSDDTDDKDDDYWYGADNNADAAE